MHGNTVCLQPGKNKDLILIYSICRCIEEKSFLWKRLRLDLIFLRPETFWSGLSLIPVILFPETLTFWLGLSLIPEILFPETLTFWLGLSLIPMILFHETLLAAPLLFKEIKSQKSKLRTFFPVTFCPWISENFYQSFYFPVFSRYFFSVTFLHNFYLKVKYCYCSWKEHFKIIIKVYSPLQDKLFCVEKLTLLLLWLRTAIDNVVKNWK